MYLFLRQLLSIAAIWGGRGRTTAVERALVNTCDSDNGPVLVLGATGETGKHVVQQLLLVDDKQRQVHVIVRSKEKMLNLLKNITSSEDDELEEKYNLKIHEVSLLDMSAEELQAAVNPVSVVVSCLGHNLNLKGMFGKPRRLVTQATQRVTDAMLQAELNNPCGSTKRKFILMNSDGIAKPDGSEQKRVLLERIILALLRVLVPPHADNEAAASYLHHTLGADSAIEWVVVRPTDLIDADAPTKYRTFDSPIGSLFGSGVVSRINVAKFMVDMIVDEDVWSKYKYQFPVVYNHDSTPPVSSEGVAKEL